VVFLFFISQNIDITIIIKLVKDITNKTNEEVRNIFLILFVNK